MRTTITLDPDVAALVRRKMHETQRGLKGVVNDALRAALADGAIDDGYRLPAPVRGGRPSVDVNRSSAVLADLDAADYRSKSGSDL